MKVVGITGGIGAGKSVVSQVFRILGIPVYDADTRAKWLMNEHPEIISSVISLFGTESYQEGRLDRAHIGKIAFHDQSLLDQLNKIVHPAVAQDFQKWYRHKTTTYVLKEAALLVENNSYKALDHLIVVSAPEAIRKERVLKRDPHRNPDDVKAILSRQLPEAQKLEVADHVIVNDETQLVIPQVLQVHQSLFSKQ